VWFKRSIATVPKWLDVLGNYAFAIYFLHGYILYEFERILTEAGVILESVPSIVFMAVVFYLAVILVFVLITFIGKKILGGTSRYFLGV
jgi:peptidoglycan/LPS O-acetylase OafA/YrhL